MWRTIWRERVEERRSAFWYSFPLCQVYWKIETFKSNSKSSAGSFLVCRGSLCFKFGISTRSSGKTENFEKFSGHSSLGLARQANSLLRAPKLLTQTSGSPFSGLFASFSVWTSSSADVPSVSSRVQPIDHCSDNPKRLYRRQANYLQKRWIFGMNRYPIKNELSACQLQPEQSRGPSRIWA